jgi:Pyruvate/2-oxoacid:ferredoxin oxidoreductase delta subunit
MEAPTMSGKILRKIIHIDEEKCDGCGLCVPACVEGALAIVEGKARLISETYCDGLGACLGECPQGAITIEEREAEAFDEDAVAGHLAAQGTPAPAADHHASSNRDLPCPSARSLRLEPCAQDATGASDASAAPSALSHWPVQLMLVPPDAPYFQGTELLVAADCVPFAYAGFHGDLLAGRALVVGCPKLDDVGFYRTKLAQILRASDIRKVTVVHMEVPCCFGLVMAVRQALAESGKDIPLEEITITIRGQRAQESRTTPAR